MTKPSVSSRSKHSFEGLCLFIDLLCEFLVILETLEILDFFCELLLFLELVCNLEFEFKLEVKIRLLSLG